MRKYTINEIKELMSMGFTPEQIARMSADTPAPKGKGKKPTGAKAQPKVEKVEYKKANGEVVMCTPAQAAHWDAWKANRSTKTLDEVKAEFEAYVPTPEHIAYMKANPNGTAKEYRANGIKVGRGDALKALKRKYIPDYKF